MIYRNEDIPTSVESDASTDRTQMGTAGQP